MFKLFRISNGWVVWPGEYIEDMMFIHDIKDIPEQLSFYLNQQKERREYNAEDLFKDLGRKQ